MFVRHPAGGVVLDVPARRATARAVADRADGSMLAAHRRRLAALGAVVAVERDPRSSDRQIDRACAAAHSARTALVEAIARRAGFDFTDPGAEAIAAGVVLASVQEDDHLFLLLVDSDELAWMWEHHPEDERTSLVRPVVLALSDVR